MPMTRFLVTACCALLAFSVWAQRTKPPSGSDCPVFPARCEINAQRFDFGRHQMNQTAPPIYSHGTISVTCTRHPQDRLAVDVPFELKALTLTPPRQMRDQIGGAHLAYDIFIDPARTRYWGDGTEGTHTLQGGCLLDEKNRVCTIVFPLYGKVHGQQELIPPGPFLGAVLARVEYSFSNCGTR